jgi:glycine/D-amino acid oxidase-like deaminating enzyme
MNRREFLRRSGLACAALSSLACFPERTWGQSAGLIQSFRDSPPIVVPDISFDRPGCNFAPVHVEARGVIRTTVGLRPYRPSGFVVRPEKVDETLVIHNYGHGGAGLTLSWGTAQLALTMGCQGHSGSAAVLGSGAVGLATARLLQEAGFKVTIYTKALPPETTSNIAGGEWFPFLVADPEKSDARFNQQLLSAAEFAYRRYLSMIGDRFGVRWVRSYSIAKDGFDEAGPMGTQSAFRGMMPEFRDLKPQEHPFPTASSVRQYDTLLIEPPRYLPAMQDDFLEASGTILVREIADRTAIAQLPEKLVFNCTGMGAKDIFGDDELTPVRGQVTYLKPQPQVDYAVAHDQLYMLPRTDGILLGGTYELGMSSLTPDIDKRRKMLARHKAFFDSYRRSG